jgi:hypothetical protein
MPRKVAPKVGDLVLVHWDDIQEESTWQDKEHPEPDVAKCLSVGYVAKWGRKAVVLVRTYQLHDGTRTAGDRISYPRAVVTGWEVLRAATP